MAMLLFLEQPDKQYIIQGLQALAHGLWSHIWHYLQLVYNTYISFMSI